MIGRPQAQPLPRASTTRTTDPQVQQARAQQVPPTGTQPPIIDLPPIEGAPEVQVPNLTPGAGRPAAGPRSRCRGRDGDSDGAGLPDRPQDEDDGRPRRSPRSAHHARQPAADPVLQPQRAAARYAHASAPRPEGVETYIVRGGINIVTQAPRFGTIDIEADSAVIWRGPSPAKGEPYKAPAGDFWVDDAQAADGGLSRRQRHPSPGREQVSRAGATSEPSAPRSSITTS